MNLDEKDEDVVDAWSRRFADVVGPDMDPVRFAQSTVAPPPEESEPVVVPPSAAVPFDLEPFVDAEDDGDG